MAKLITDLKDMADYYRGNAGPGGHLVAVKIDHAVEHIESLTSQLSELKAEKDGMVLVPESILDNIRLRQGHLSNYGRYIEARSYEEILDLFDCMLQASKEGE